MFGTASTVRIEAGSITFVSVHGGGAAQLRALARVLCPDTLGEAVLETYRQVSVRYITSHFQTVGWAQFLHALICERAHVFAFEADTRFCRVRIAWRRWPPRGTRAHKAAVELHFQAAEWASLEA